MNRARREHGAGRIAAVALLAIGIAAPAIVAAQDCEIPMFVQSYAGEANVMILMDNSGSMNEAILHPDYDPTVTYAGTFQSEQLYFVTRNGVKEPSDFNITWPSAPSAYLVCSDNGEDGRYYGNYLNWIYYHATDVQRAGIPQLTRIQVAKIILCDVIDRADTKIRFGIADFALDHGASIEGKCGKSTVALQAIINGMTANAWTPTGEAMEDILDYFSDTGPDAPILFPCMFNFLIVCTDGYPTMDLDVSSYLWDADGDGNDPGNCASIGSGLEEWNNCSDYMDDVAYYMRNNDLRPDMDGPGAQGVPFQHVCTYTIGYGIDAPLMEETAINGDGEYYVANNAWQLLQAFERALMDIIMRISSGSAVAVVSTERGDNDRLFRGKFMPGSWDGYLESYALPYSDGDDPVWEAGYILSHRWPSDRWVFTAIDDVVYDFSPAMAGVLAGPMGMADLVAAQNVISAIRGEEVPGMRDRDGWVLGDVIHSTPVIVGAPTNFQADPDYQRFMEYYQDRDKMIYVGANDGQLHAFRADDGWEAWSFVPEFALPKLPAIADTSYCHLYTVDETVSVTDCRYGGTWRTVLIGGAREGGSSIFCLDITEPWSPQVLWQRDLPDGHSFTAQAEFAQVGESAIALVGSGVDDTDGRAWMYGYDIETGDMLGSVLLSEDAGVRNKATSARVVDRNMDGTTDIVYIGDLQGHVWRFDVDGSTNVDGWYKSELFYSDQPIMAPPVPACGDDGDIYVYFGTGAYIDEDDLTDLSEQTFYCVFDSHDHSSHSPGSMSDQTDGVGDVGTADGWYVTLENSDGERVTEEAAVIAGAVLFTSFSPEYIPCGSGGRSWLYRLSYDDGSTPEGADGEPPLDRIQELSDGIASRPVVDIVNQAVIIQSSDASINIEQIGVPYNQINVRAWQENFDHVVEPADEGAITP